MTADRIGHLEDMLERALWQINRLVEHATCRRCSDPEPPPHRWPGDPWARDNRGPHTCERCQW